MATALKPRVIDRIEDLFFASGDVYARSRLIKERNAAGELIDKMAYAPACQCSPTCTAGAKCPHWKPEPVSGQIIDDHMTKPLHPRPHTIGSYTLSADEKVAWICFDIDAHAESEIDRIEMVDAAQRGMKMLQGVARDEGLPIYFENSGRGLHGWVFVKTSAQIAYHAGRAMLQEVKDRYGEAPAVEVFPKQKRHGGNRFGNLVKLPYGKHYTGYQTRFIDISTLEPLPNQWTNGGLLDFERADAGRIETLANKLIYPRGGMIPLQTVQQPMPEGLQAGPPCVSNLLKARIAEGEMGGRNNALFQLVVDLRRGGIMNEEWIFNIAEEWNSRQLPPIEHAQFVGTVRSAMNPDTRFSYGCDKEEFCSYFCDAKSCPIEFKRQSAQQFVVATPAIAEMQQKTFNFARARRQMGVNGGYIPK